LLAPGRGIILLAVYPTTSQPPVALPTEAGSVGLAVAVVGVNVGADAVAMRAKRHD
jgi:hypothetical protein